jgi:hypothetical protein
MTTLIANPALVGFGHGRNGTKPRVSRLAVQLNWVA